MSDKRINNAELIDLTDEQPSSNYNELSSSNSNESSISSSTIPSKYDSFSPSTPTPSSSRLNNQQINLSSIAPSPPKYIAMDELMKATNGVTNMYLSHQICLNENFEITKQSNPNSLRGQVETAMKSTYWKILGLLICFNLF